MNPLNETIVSGEMYEAMRKEGVAKDYMPVPKRLRPAAERLLGGKRIASMDKRFRYLSKKSAVRAGNRRHEQALKEARERILVQ